jgi:hypothetical protein
MVKVQECQPINKQAAMGISHKEYETIGRSQYAYLSKKRVVHECPIVGKPSALLNLPDLIGVRNGRVVVIGYCSPMENFRVFGSSRSSKRSGSWVVKCDCGKYERRTTKEIRKPPKKEYIDACTFCRGAWAESVKAKFRDTGIKPVGGLPTHKSSMLLTQPKEKR